MKPYYEYNGITIYRGDCRKILPRLDRVDLVLTDPPYGIHNSINRRGFMNNRIGHEAVEWDVKPGRDLLELR